MADSETSRTLPAITRRKLLYAPVPTAIALAASSALPTNAAARLPSANDTDPVLHLFAAWHAAHARYLALGDARWDTEVAIYRQAEFPEVEIRLPNGERFFAVAEEEIDMGLALPSMAKERAMARADLAAMNARWDELDEQIGYSRALEAETLAAEKRAALAKSVFRAPARSAAGAVAKLCVFIEMNTRVTQFRKQLHPELRRLVEPSFPDLRVLLTELAAMGGVSDDLRRA